MDAKGFGRRIVVYRRGRVHRRSPRRALAAAGDEPIVLDDLSTGDPANMPGDVAVVRYDVTDVDEVSPPAPRPKDRDRRFA